MIQNILIAVIVLLILILLQMIWKQLEHDYEISALEINPDELLKIAIKHQDVRTRNKKNRTQLLKKSLEHRNRTNKYYTYNYVNELQNVHDSQVSHDIREKYKRLVELTKDHIDEALNEFDINTLNDNIKYEIETYINEIFKDNVSNKSKALASLMYIYNSNDNISSITNNENIKEMDILSAVWCRINILNLDNKGNDIRDNLMTRLLEASKIWR